MTEEVVGDMEAVEGVVEVIKDAIEVGFATICVRNSLEG